MSTKYLHGVWRPGSGAQYWRTGMKFSELEAWDEKYVAKGLRMYDLVHEKGDGYTALWRASKTPTRWIAGAKSATEFKAWDTGLFQDGFRIFNASRRSWYCGVWRKGSGTQWWKSGMSLATFKKEDAKHFKNGLRLAHVETYKSGSAQKYFASWRPGKGAQYWMAGSGVAGADQAYFNLGYRIKERSHGPGSSVFVWTKGSGAQWWTAKTISAFKAYDTKLFKKGLRLVYLNVGFGL